MKDPFADIDDGLPPGGVRAVGESEWTLVLETAEPLHQWGGALLVEEPGPSGLLRLWLRDDTGSLGHCVLRLDVAASARTRAALAELDQAARRVADLLAAEQTRGSSSIAQLDESQAASAAYVARAQALYRELLSPLRRTPG